ncbi:MAG: ABC transporter substrate-binding protein, partial [Janthinobacterium lividum]
MRTALAACLRHTAGVLLATLAVTSMSAVTSTSAMAQDANAPIAIGMVLSKQGVFSDIGRDGARGAMLAVDDVDAKVLGRPIKVIWYDDTDPQTAQQNMIKLIDHDKVVAVVGGVNSASSLAEGSVAKQNKIPLVVIVGSATEITGKS